MSGYTWLTEPEGDQGEVGQGQATFCLDPGELQIMSFTGDCLGREASGYASSVKERQCGGASSSSWWLREATVEGQAGLRVRP